MAATKKAKTPAKKKKPAQRNYKAEYELKESRRRQSGAIVLFAVGILLACIAFIPGTNIWNGIHTSLFGLLGVTLWILPVAFIYIAIMETLDKPIGDINNKIWQTCILAILCCGLFEITSLHPYSGDSFSNVLATLFQNGEHLTGGGFFASLIGWPLYFACGKTGAIIIIVLLLFTFIMLLTGSTLIGLFRGMVRPVRKMNENYLQKREEAEHNARFDIDVDLGPDPPMPEHPVSSPKPSLDDLLELEKKQSDSQKQLIDNLKESIPETKEDPVKETPESNSIPPFDPEPIFDSNDQARLYTDNENNVRQYIAPPITLLKAPKGGTNRDISGELKTNAELLVSTLKNFGVETRILNVSHGPTVTRYELQPKAGVKISKITSLSDDIALNLAAAGVRIEAPIPNKAAVGIEVPNRKTDIVTIREIIEDSVFEQAKSKLTAALGRDITGNTVVADIAKMPHVLIAGATGSGKSVCINSMIISLLYKASPSEVRFLMIDPKVVELGVYNGIPHLLVPVVTDPRKAAGALGWAVTEMLKRYKQFADNNVRDINGYNSLAKGTEGMNPMPQIVIVIDELADLMMAAPNEVEDSICRLAQMARAAGMHLVIATQRPSVDVITGIIKANIPSRIAFAVSSQVDSRTILDSGGAEKLLGRGDMLFYPVGIPKPIRVQGCFVSDKEVEQVVNFVQNKESAKYDDEIMEEIEKQAVPDKNASENNEKSDSSDELLDDAIECIVQSGQASTSFLQRKLKVGYARAARLIDDMEEMGIVGPFEGSKPRKVLIDRQQWIEMRMNHSTNSTAPEKKIGGTPFCEKVKIFSGSH